ncbi:MAG: hypothetical protein J6I49_04335 [Bacteroidales bacterium]|nr:hypothetical protein [Bacteroidales bacterium]
MKKTQFLLMLLTALCLVGVNGRAQSNPVHTMTFINEGGGYFSFIRSTPDGQSVDTTYSHVGSFTKTLQVQEGSSVYVGLSSERRDAFFYGEIRGVANGSPRLLHFYVDNQEVPLDSIYSFYDEEGFYYWYSYTLANITSDHTFRAVFGEWEEDINPTPRPTHTVTFIKQGNGNMYGGCSHGDGIFISSSSLYDRDTLRLTAEEGLHFYVEFEGIRPDSWYWNPNIDRDQQPLHLYVDDVEIPIDSLSRSFDCFTVVYGYSYRQIVTSDHVVRVVFGPVDTTQLPPLHTIGVVNEGGGYIDYYELSSYNLSNIIQMPDTIPFQAEEGMDVNIVMRSLRPESGRYEEYSNPRLLHFYVDGIEIPLDSIYMGFDGRGSYIYMYTLSDISSSHTIRTVYGQWDILPSIHAMTIVNHGGGKIHSPRPWGCDDYRELLVSGGDPFTLRMDSYRPDSPHYGDYANPKLLHFYVDDVEVPLGSIFDGYDAATGALRYVYTDSNVASNHIFRAEFGPWSDDEYVLTLEANDPAMGTVAGGGTYLMGDSATLTATPNEGYRFVSWQDGNTDNPRTVTVTADATYIATFEAEVGITDVVGNDDIHVWHADGSIHVSGTEGMEVHVYDITGRRVGMERLRSGVYMVRVGALPALKVVVIEK